MVTRWIDGGRNRLSRTYFDVWLWKWSRTAKSVAEGVVLSYRLPSINSRLKLLRYGRTNANSTAFNAAAFFGRY